jgi:hypothetical protein
MKHHTNSPHYMAVCGGSVPNTALRINAKSCSTSDFAPPGGEGLLVNVLTIKATDRDFLSLKHVTITYRSTSFHYRYPHQAKFFYVHYKLSTAILSCRPDVSVTFKSSKKSSFTSWVSLSVCLFLWRKFLINISSQNNDLTLNARIVIISKSVNGNRPNWH